MESMTLLQALDPCSGSALPLDTDAGLPRFGDPWHAQAFGTAMALARAGAFTWKTSVETFSAEIRTNPQRPSKAADEAYYRQWLAALDTRVQKTGALSSDELADAAEHWRRSYLHTPHGRPVELSRGWPPHNPDIRDDHHHHHHHHGIPRM